MTSKRFTIKRNANTVEFAYDKYDHSSFIFIAAYLYFIINFFMDFKLEHWDSFESIWSLLFFLISLYFLHSTIDTSFNQRIVSIAKDFVSISESPIPTHLNVKIKHSDIVKVFTKTEIIDNEEILRHYRIFFLLKDNTEFLLFKHIYNFQEAKSIESSLQGDLFIESE